ncbi:MAG: DUF4321 domain-containing protein [Oscillospiraceae bacterium]
MSKDTKKTLAFLFFLLAGILVGSAVAYFTKDIFFLSWLSYGINFGIPSSTLDLYVFRLTAGVELDVNIAHVIFIILSILAYTKISPKL